MVGGDAAVVAELIDAFLEDGPETLRQLRAGVIASDAEMARRAAHTLKSNGSTFGARELEALCREQEERARVGDLSNALALVDRIDAEWVDVRDALARLR